MPKKLQPDLLEGGWGADKKGEGREGSDWKNEEEEERWSTASVLVQPDETSFSLLLVGVFSQIMFDGTHPGESHKCTWQVAAPPCNQEERSNSRGSVLTTSGGNARSNATRRGALISWLSGITGVSSRFNESAKGNSGPDPSTVGALPGLRLSNCDKEVAWMIRGWQLSFLFIYFFKKKSVRTTYKDLCRWFWK